VMSVGRKFVDLDGSPGVREVRFVQMGVASYLAVRIDRQTLRAWNFTPGRVFRAIDPTWDDMDDEAGDFLMTVARLARDVDANDRLRTVWPFRHCEGGSIELLSE
jgi:hypothetical protein